MGLGTRDDAGASLDPPHGQQMADERKHFTQVNRRVSGNAMFLYCTSWRTLEHPRKRHLHLDVCLDDHKRIHVLLFYIRLYQLAQHHNHGCMVC